MNHWLTLATNPLSPRGKQRKIPKIQKKEKIKWKRREPKMGGGWIERLDKLVSGEDSWRPLGPIYRGRANQLRWEIDAKFMKLSFFFWFAWNKQLLSRERRNWLISLSALERTAKPTWATAAPINWVALKNASTLYSALYTTYISSLLRWARPSLSLQDVRR